MLFLVKLIFSVFCLIGIINPELSWKMSEGWKFKDAEPSEMYLFATRAASVIILIFIWLVFPRI